MAGRIILSQADFSGNNIGRVIVLSELTKKVLARQTQYAEDSAEAAALNGFLESLTENGFIGGENPLLNCLIIPALAASHDEMLYDIARLDGNGYPTDLMAADEKTATNKAFAVDTANEKVVGLKRTSTSPDSEAQAAIVTSLFTEFGAYPSFSLLTYRNAQSVPASNSFIFIGNTTTGTKVRYTKTDLRMLNGSTIALERAISFDGTNGLRGFTGLSFNNDDKDFELLSDNVTLGERTYDDGQTIQSSINESTLLAANTFTLGTFANTNNTFFSLLAISKYQNSEKMAQFKGFVETLMTQIHVKTW